MAANTGVSVVMSVYNGERFLPASIESVLAQSFREFELIVVDDGSTDSSPRIVESFAARDPRVRLLRQEHGGVGRAVNFGVREARYELIARTDSDDVMLPQRLERQMAFLAAHPELDVVFSYCYFINAAGKRIGSSTPAVDVESARRERRPSTFAEPTQSTALMRKAALLEVGGYRPFSFAEDRDLWGRFETAGHRIGLQPEFLIEFRLHGGSMTMRGASMQHEFCTWVDFNLLRRWDGKEECSLEDFRAWKRTRPLASRVREMLDFGAVHAFKRASRLYGEGRYCRSAVTLAAAVSLNPAGVVRRVVMKLRKPEPCSTSG